MRDGMSTTRFELRIAVLILALLGGMARAETPEAQARRHYEAGSRAFALGEFQRAITEYRAAFNAKAVPAILYNIGQAYRLAGDSAQAVFFYRSFLSREPGFPGRRDLERRIRELEAQIARAAEAKPVEARPVEPPRLENDPKLARAQPSPAPEVVVAWSEPRWEEPARAKPPSKDPVHRKWWLWTGVGVVAAGVAVGLGVGLTSGGVAPAPASHFGATVVF
jgi:tetratricopeptide (TPR) repeat protein